MVIYRIQVENGRMKQKYNSKKIIVDGIKFDSRKEASRYVYLKQQEKAGLISDLELQKKFVLIPKQTDGKKTVERECAYYADFVYVKDGETVVEDVKGYRNGQAYALFTIKRKLMLYVHSIRVKEV